MILKRSAALAAGLVLASTLSSDSHGEPGRRQRRQEDRRSQEVAKDELRSETDATPQSPPKVEPLRNSVDSEMSDVARAFRKLDQSYAFRGMQGCGSWTAGSAFTDFGSRGEEPHPVFPPPPLKLGCDDRRVQIPVGPIVGPVATADPTVPSSATGYPHLVGPQSTLVVNATRFQLLDDGILGTAHQFQTQGESYRVEGLAEGLLQAARASNKLKIEITLQPTGPTRGFVPIICFAKRADCGNLVLGQNGQQLILRLRTDAAPRLAMYEIALTELGTDRKQIVVQYSTGQLTVSVDGTELGSLRDVNGGFSGWTPQPLTIGNPALGPSWNGTLFGVFLETAF